jgi:lauroyl/myristoyl acyltransferase
MRFVVGEDESAEVVERLAKGYVRRSLWRGEARFHPHLMIDQRVEGLEILQGFRDRGQGVVLNFAHHGEYETMCAALGRLGVPSHAFVTSAMWDPASPLWMQQSLKLMDEAEGMTVVDVARGSAYAREVVLAGEMMAISPDQPGHTPMTFLGHEMSLSSGAARLAFETNSPVVTMTSAPDPDRPHATARLIISEPLYPQDFESAEALLEAMVRLLEAAFLSWPEASEHPRRMLNSSLAKKPGRHPFTDGDATRSPA